MRRSTICRSLIKTAACCSRLVKTVLNRVNSGSRMGSLSHAATKFLWRTAIIGGCKNFDMWGRVRHEETRNSKFEIRNKFELPNSKSAKAFVGIWNLELVSSFEF